ncbi:hypothetical protein D3C87_2015240 [compost metagenome]
MPITDHAIDAIACHVQSKRMSSVRRAIGRVTINAPTNCSVAVAIRSACCRCCF